MICDEFDTPGSPDRFKRSGFCFGTVNSRDYGVYFTDVKAFGTPQRDVTFQTVPGRNGDLMLDNHRWNNLPVTYRCVVLRDFCKDFTDFFGALLSQNGYQKLQDTIRPDRFRMAVLQDPIEPEVRGKGRVGFFDLAFYCKPQRFLVRGEYIERFSAPRTLLNPTGFPARPLITVCGSGPGTVTVGSATVQIKALNDRLILDCDTMDAYRQMGDAPPENKNGEIYAPEFPELLPGVNTVSWTGGITSVDIVPRWWTL